MIINDDNHDSYDHYHHVNVYIIYIYIIVMIRMIMTTIMITMMCYDLMIIMIILISPNILVCRFVAQNSSPTNRGVSQPLLALDVGPHDARIYQLDKQSTTFGTSLDSSSWYCLTGDKPWFMWKKMRNTRVFCGHSPNYTNPRRMGTVSFAITLLSRRCSLESCPCHPPAVRIHCWSQSLRLASATKSL